MSKEESSGPSFSLYTANTNQEAIDIIKSNRNALNAVLHSADLMRTLEAAEETDTGQVHINNMIAHDEPTIPLGGIKASGWGRNDALWGIRKLTNIKVVKSSSKGSECIKGSNSSDIHVRAAVIEGF
ncbi:hypothetical protein LTR29_017561 [Friedmanniomyces endolithicus]|nr:hypothetical protein LTR29_017561 [Friedmanniomyces endolithicus]